MAGLRRLTGDDSAPQAGAAPVVLATAERPVVEVVADGAGMLLDTPQRPVVEVAPGDGPTVLHVVEPVGGSTTVLATPTYDPVAHRWLRFSESGGTVTWSTSPDGSTWTSRGTWAPSFAVTGVWAFLGAGGGGTSYFDNVNVVPSGDNTKFFLAAA